MNLRLKVKKKVHEYVGEVFENQGFIRFIVTKVYYSESYRKTYCEFSKLSLEGEITGEILNPAFPIEDFQRYLKEGRFKWI